MENITRGDYVRLHSEHGHKITNRTPSPILPDEQALYLIGDKIFLVSSARRNNRGKLIEPPIYYIGDDFIDWL